MSIKEDNRSKQLMIGKSSSPEVEEVDGPQIAAKILAKMRPENREKIVKAIQAASPEIAEKIEDNLFDFEKLVKLQGSQIQSLVQQAVQHDLALSLKASSEELKSIFFNNMSERKRREVQEEMVTLPQVLAHQSRAAQRRIIKIAEGLTASNPPAATKEGLWA